MAQRDKTLVGVDIDPSGITAAQVSAHGDLKIERAAIAPLTEGVVRDGEVEDVEGLSAALRGLFRDNRGFGKRVRVGVANQKIVVRVMEAPPTADKRELDAVVRFHAQDQLPMPLDQAVIDYHPLELVDSEAGRRQRVLLVAARRDMVERVIAAVRGAGLRPEGVDLSAFAMMRAAYRPRPEDDLVLYLSVGGLVNLAVGRGPTCLFTRTSAGGMQALAVELAERRALTLEQAREWLGRVGLDRLEESIDGDPAIVREARKVLLDGRARIANEVRNSLDFHGTRSAGGVVSRAVLSGPATAIPGFAAALASELTFPVEPAVIAGAPGGLDPATFTVAAGLAVEEVRA